MKNIWQALTTNVLEKLILLYIFLLPLSTVFIFSEKFINDGKWEPATGTIYFTEILLWLIFFVFLFKNYKKSKINLQKIKFSNKESIITILLWLFIAFAGLSIIWAPEKISTFYLWLKLIQAGILFFIILQSQIKLQAIAWALIISGSLQSLLSMWQFLSQEIIGNKFLGLIATKSETLGALIIEEGSGRWLRSHGAFNDPNFLAGFLALILILSFQLYLKSSYKKIILGLIILNFFGLFFTFSRGAFVALLIAILIIVINNRKKIFEILPILLSLLLSFLILSLIFQSLLFSRLDNFQRLTQKSNQERLGQNYTSLTLFQKKPIIGTGFNNYNYNLYLNNSNLPNYQYKRVENIYLLILNELGLIGLILLMTIILIILNNSIKTKNIIGFSVIITLLILGLFYHYPLSQYQGLSLTFIILSLGLINNKDYEKRLS